MSAPGLLFLPHTLRRGDFSCSISSLASSWFFEEKNNKWIVDRISSERDRGSGALSVKTFSAESPTPKENKPFI